MTTPAPVEALKEVELLAEGRSGGTSRHESTPPRR